MSEATFDGRPAGPAVFATACVCRRGNAYGIEVTIGASRHWFAASLGCSVARAFVDSGEPELAGEMRVQLVRLGAMPFPPPALTRRETQVLQLIGTGMTVDEVAGSLRLTVNTVKTYLQTAMGKLNARNRVQALNRAGLGVGGAV